MYFYAIYEQKYKVGLDLLGKLYRDGVFADGAVFTIESGGITYKIDEL